MKKILFVCTGNVDRSPTAERIYKNHPELEVKSAGIPGYAQQPVSEELLQWADVILCMEDYHKRFIMNSYGNLIFGKIIDYLDIADEYSSMDPMLEIIIKKKVDAWLSNNRK